MLRLIVATLFVCWSLLGQSQDEYVVFLDSAKHLHKKEKNIDAAIELP